LRRASKGCWVINSRWRWLLVLLGCYWLCPASAQAQAPLHIASAQVQHIEGFGYTPPPYVLDPAQLQDSWKTVSLPHALKRRLMPDGAPSELHPPTIVTWYKLQLPALPASVSPRYLYIPRWKTDGQIAVYGDSRLLYQSHANVFWNGWNIPLYIALDATADTASPSVIWLRIQRPRDAGGGVSTVWLGNDAALSWRYHLRYLLQAQLPYMSSVAFLTAGLFSLLLWLRHRQETLYLLFFGVSVASFLRTLHYHVGENQLLLPEDWFSWLTVNSLFWLFAVVHFFLNYLHQRPLRWLNAVVLFATGLMSIVTLPILTGLTVLPKVYEMAPLAYIVLLVMGGLVCAMGFYQSKKATSRDGLLLSTWCLIGMVFWLHDWLLQGNHIDIEDIYLGPYTNFLAFLLFLGIMFRRYVGAIDEVKQVNASLAQRLLARETELAQSWADQRDIEHRQTLADERQRMMQDMHDGMGSSLRTALLAIERGQIDAAVVADVLKGCIDDLKLAIDAMEPVQADLLLLLATLRYRLGPRLEAAGIALRWDIGHVPQLDWIDPRNALHILRILQEAFTNIIKHTHATAIRVATSVQDNTVVVSLTDNGSGFDVSQGLCSGGKGMGNQLRRAESIGADVNWNSSASGTCLSLRLPIHRASPNATGKSS